MARDNFPKPIVRKLRDRVAHRCSNPECRVPTSAPKEVDGVNNLGIAAHISAASKGGARYDPSMAKKDRISIENGIWLCSICASKIDNDEKRYTVNLLKDWRRQAEEKALQELGNKLPSNNEAIDTVAAALTGFPKNFIATAISNVHTASDNSLQNLDPRFSVKSSYIDGVPLFDIHAKENVSISMRIGREISDEYIKKYYRLVEHRDDIEIGAEYVKFDGSKLFEEVLSEKNGVITVSSKKIDGTLKLWIVQKNTGIIYTFDDMTGFISCGTKTFSFKGKSCGNMFNFECKVPLDTSNSKVDISMSLATRAWDRVNVCDLPYFEKILSFFSRLSDGWELCTSLEIRGEKVFSGSRLNLSDIDYFQNVGTLLSYIRKCRILSEGIGCEILYLDGVYFSEDEHRELSDAVDILEGNRVFDGKSCGIITSDLIAEESGANIRYVASKSEPGAMRMTQSYGEEITIFGCKIVLPPVSICLESVIPRITSDISEVKVGDVVEVEWVKQEGFSGLMRYELGGNSSDSELQSECGDCRN